MDKNCHQSLHFVFQDLKAQTDYLQTEYECPITERRAWHIDTLLRTVQGAEEAGQPYELIVFTAQSYEGLVYDIPGIIGALLAAGISTRKFLVDEAWGAVNYFHPELAPLTAMHLDPLCSAYPDLEVVCTHSTHKSLSAMRQASMIHFRSGKDLRMRLDKAKFRMHSTSPSYPILASLDLAQAQMAVEGIALARQARELAQSFKQQLSKGEAWSCYSLSEAPDMGTMSAYVKEDPCKVSIDVSELGLSTEEVQGYLHQKHGIYLNRITRKTLLVNFHIGSPDQGYLDQEGRLYLVNRADHGSHQAPLYSLENTLRALPCIDDIALLQQGDSIRCAYTVKPCSRDDAALKQRIAQAADDAQIALLSCRHLEKIPYSPSGKVRVSDLAIALEAGS